MQWTVSLVDVRFAHEHQSRQAHRPLISKLGPEATRMTDNGNMNGRVILAAVFGVIMFFAQVSSAQPQEVILYWSYARADGTNPDYEKGAWHPVILFSAEKSEDDALAECFEVLKEDGWDVFVVKETATVDSSRVKSAPDDFRDAWRDAQKGGCYVVVISERLKPEDEPELPKEFRERIE